jgi:anti-sigma regulatory factor (Ser/Thr protein kinase)
MTQARFAADPGAVGEARRLVEGALGEVPATVRDAAVLMASELATNCVVHARTGFEIRVEHTAGTVRVTVSDCGAGDPVLQWPASSDERGRGLQIVQTLSDDWGSLPAAGPTGKTVWFTLAVGAV